MVKAWGGAGAGWSGEAGRLGERGGRVEWGTSVILSIILKNGK